MAFTPSQRGPALGDERVFSGARERDPVLREVGHTTENIRTTGVVDVTAGNSGMYDFGAVDRASIGRYNVRAQEAASVTAAGLGTYLWLQFDIHEETAGEAALHEALFLPMSRTLSASMTHDQPLKIISIPTNKPITQTPDAGHCL